MARYILARLGQAVLVLFVVATVVFMLSRASGNVADLMVPQDAPANTRAQIEKNLGLDKPMIVQYGRYMKDLAHGDLGQSFAYRRDVRGLIFHALPNTIELGVCAFGFAVFFGIAIGVRSATRPGGWVDNIGKGLALAGQSVPSFWLGILLVMVFAVKLGWVPPFGQGGLKRLVLPSISLGAYALASLTRLTRSAVIEVLRKDHTLFERAKGVSAPRLVLHTLRNASLPIVTLAGIQLGTLFSGAVIVETIFAWPGVGQMAIQGINSRDYNVVQGVVLVNTAIFVFLLFIVDISYGLLDPRVRRHSRGVATAS
ncbi:MAG: glutathione transport system permease protein [Acidimicrobiaceae bacterium]|nr:glutathione transport system permease protein [Acidimicrobiaceae bacterium]